MDWMEEKYNPNLIKPKDSKWAIKIDSNKNLFSKKEDSEIDFDAELDKYSKEHFLPELQIQENLWFITNSQASMLRWLTTPDSINDGLVWLKANKAVQEAIWNPIEKWITKEQKEELIKLTDPKNYDMWVLYDSIYVSEKLSRMRLDNLKIETKKVD